MRSFAGEYGLEVVAVDKGRRAMTLRGTVKAVAEAFEAQGLQVYEHPTAGHYRGRQGPLTVPSSLAGVITGVFGIDDRPQARAHLRRRAAQSRRPVVLHAAAGRRRVQLSDGRRTPRLRRPRSSSSAAGSVRPISTPTSRASA